MYSPSREELAVKTEPEDEYGDSRTVLGRSLSADTRDDSCASDSASQSHDEDGGTASGSSSATNVEPSSARLHTTRSRHYGDPDRRARRAIANSNERRRMQSINAGFQSLHELVKPRHGEKLSKAAILQRAVDYIADLHRQKAQLVAKNARLMQLLDTGTGNGRPEVTSSLPGATKRRRLESLSSCSLSSDDCATNDAPVSGSRRRKLKADRRESDSKSEDSVEDLRITSFPLTSATLPVATQAAIPEPSVVATSCSDSIRSLLTSATPSITDQSSGHRSNVDRSPLTVWNASTTSSDRLWTSTSRRNLETILEAIRHLEGDHCQPASHAGQSASNALSLTEVLMASASNVQLTPSKACVAVRSS